MKSVLTILLATVLLSLAPAAAKAEKKAVPSAAVQKEFDDFIAKFRAALSANDPAAVAAMTQLPFMNEKDVGDAAQFRAKTYKTFFTPKNRTCIQRGKAIYDRDPEKHESYSIFCGEPIFVFTKTPSGFLFTDIGVND